MSSSATLLCFFASLPSLKRQQQIIIFVSHPQVFVHVSSFTIRQQQIILSVNNKSFSLSTTNHSLFQQQIIISVNNKSLSLSSTNHSLCQQQIILSVNNKSFSLLAIPSVSSHLSLHSKAITNHYLCQPI